MIRKTTRVALLSLVAALVPSCGDEETVTIIQTLPALPGSTGSGGFGSFGGAVVPGMLFTADRNQVDVFELWSTDLAGSVLVNLSGPLAVGGSVGVFRWSPDRSRVAFVADKELDGVTGIFVVPAVGGTPVKVAEVPFGGGLYTSPVWSPDSSRLVYTLDDGAGRIDLWTVRHDGAGAVNLTATFTTTSAPSLADPQPWSPDSARMAAIVKDGANPGELYTMLADGSAAPVKVSGALVAGGEVLFYVWAPNGSRLAYQADQDVDEDIELYSTLPTSAASVVQLSGTLPANGDVSLFQVKWSPDSSRVAYKADETTNDIPELYSAPAATAGASVRINPAFAAGEEVQDFEWAPDGSRVAYRALVAAMPRLYTTLPASAASVVEVSTLPPPGGAGVSVFVWSPTSARLLYQSDQTTAGFPQIFTAPAAVAASSVAASQPSLSGVAILPDPKWAPDGSRLAYQLDQDTSGVQEFYTAPAAAAGASVKVSGTASAYFTPLFSKWTSDGSRLVYSTVNGSIFGPTTAVFSTSPTAVDPVLLSGPLLPNRRVIGWTLR